MTLPSFTTPSLSIVTISKHFDGDFCRTIQSISSNIPYHFHSSCELVCVLSTGHQSTVSQYLSEHSSTLSFQLVLGQDTSLYNAMNIGLRHSKGLYVLFLNAGDSMLYSAAFINQILASDSPSKLHIHSFSSLQSFRANCWYRRSKPRVNLLNRKVFPPHQSFIVPLSKDIPVFDENSTLNADTLWIAQCMKLYSTIYYDQPLSLFQLGGLSNKPSLSLLKLRLSQGSIFHAGVELLKLAIYSLIGANRYYRLVFLLAGMPRISS